MAIGINRPSTYASSPSCPRYYSYTRQWGAATTYHSRSSLMPRWTITYVERRGRTRRRRASPAMPLLLLRGAYKDAPLSKGGGVG